MSEATALQDRLHPEAPIRHCYGCGADNANGLKIKSALEGDEVVSRWQPQQHHCSYPGYLNGGIACTLIDCHSAWTAFALECRDQSLNMEQRSDLPTGWTRAMSVEFLKPTPLDAEITLRAGVVKKGRTSRTVACSLYANDEECVRAQVTLVMTGA
jgi:acyl-coenzyme A thioesterase PaaI-like protein